ncbi:MAG: hypothetical protein AB1585_08500 [Thermodesulfobacteriota bacterium]
MADITEPFLHSPIQTKIAWANTFFKREGKRLLKDHPLVDLIEALKAAIHNSRQQMIESGMVDCCRECDEKEGGSCCGAGLERHYSGRILLINLLLGQTLPRSRETPAGCYFLSGKGCRLLAREVLCINYMCKKITTEIKPDQISALKMAEGEEILLLFQLTTLLKKLLT